MSKKFILIKNGKLVSKDHNLIRKDILIEDDKIKEIKSQIEENEKFFTIDAEDKIVSPGFIDIHSHCDTYFFSKKHIRLFEPILLQGVTTSVGGNCGLSMFPITGKNLEEFNNFIGTTVGKENNYKWRSFYEYAKFVKDNLLMNMAALVGCGSLRVNVAGFKKDLTEGHFNEMEELLMKALDEGCFGLSSGLIYVPGTFSTTEELIRLTRTARKKYPDALYATHLRGYAETLLDALKEAIEIGEISGIKVQCSHLHVGAPKFNPMVFQIIELINNARKRGVDVTYDSLSYPGGCSTIMILFPPWSYEKGVDKFLEDIKDESFYKEVIDYMNNYIPVSPVKEIGAWVENFINSLGWENLFVVGSHNKDLFGKNFIQISEERGVGLYKALREVMIEEKADIHIYFRGWGGAYDFNNDEDLKYFDMLIENKLSHVAVDAFFSEEVGSTYTPFMYGAFPRIINRYVKSKKTLTLKDAIERFTCNAAERIGIKKRGNLKKGYYADIVVFDYDKYTDYPVIFKNQKYTTGMEYVLINGKISVENGKSKNNCNGKVVINQ